jgi:hypothetical protein
LNEWEFAGEVKSWWDQELIRNPLWKLDRWAIEKKPDPDGLKRSDLSLVSSGNILCVGELRLPDHPRAGHHPAVPGTRSREPSAAT